MAIGTWAGIFIAWRLRARSTGRIPDELRLPEGTTSWRAYVMMFLCLFLWITTRFSTCMHAATLSNTLVGYGFSYSSNGGPCHNSDPLDGGWHLYGNWYIARLTDGISTGR